MPLTNKTILITGAAGGLGKTAAFALAKQGATLILLDKKIPVMEWVYDQIVALGAVEPILYPFDLVGANENEYQELANAIHNKYGSLQGVLHSAADIGTLGPIATQKISDWANTLTVNLSSCFLLSRVLLPVLQQSDKASIVFTSDSSFREARAYSAAYGVSKIALEAFAKILAEEYEAEGKIRVNTLIPNVVNSPIRNRTHPAEEKSLLPAMESIAAAYCYLFSSESEGITGQTLDAQSFAN